MNPAPTLQTEPSQPRNWAPGWLLEKIPGAKFAFDEITRCKEVIDSFDLSSYESFSLQGSWFNPMVDAAKTGKQPGDASTYRVYCWATLYGIGSSVQSLERLTFLRTVSVKKQLEWTSRALSEHDWIHGAVTMRGCLEHVASLCGILNDLKPFKPDVAADNNTIEDIGYALRRRMGATRIDWKMVSSNPDVLLNTRAKKKSVELRPEEGQKDVRAGSILKDIDLLDRQIPGTRNFYDILCEFLHPNFGISLGLMGDVGAAREPHTRVPLIRTIYTENSVPLPEDAMVPLWQNCFARFADVIAHFLSNREEATILYAALLEQTRKVIRLELSRMPDLRAPYAFCPCGGGKKVRFCCGAPKV